MDSKRGRFFGAPISKVKGPFEYARTIAGGGIKARERQFTFLSGVKHKRFLELQRITGAFQGSNPLNRNQLLDAFHLWCAEHSHCEFFLTLDFKAIKVVQRSPRKPLVQLVRPSELIAIVEGRMSNASSGEA